MVSPIAACMTGTGLPPDPDAVDLETIWLIPRTIPAPTLAAPMVAAAAIAPPISAAPTISTIPAWQRDMHPFILALHSSS